MSLRRHPTAGFKTDQEKMAEFFKDVPKQLIRDTKELYKEDFELFGYEYDIKDDPDETYS